MRRIGLTFERVGEVRAEAAGAAAPGTPLPLRAVAGLTSRLAIHPRHSEPTRRHPLPCHPETHVERSKCSPWPRRSRDAACRGSLRHPDWHVAWSKEDPLAKGPGRVDGSIRRISKTLRAHSVRSALVADLPAGPPTRGGRTGEHSRRVPIISEIAVGSHRARSRTVGPAPASRSCEIRRSRRGRLFRRREHSADPSREGGVSQAATPALRRGARSGPCPASPRRGP